MQNINTTYSLSDTAVVETPTVQTIDSTCSLLPVSTEDSIIICSPPPRTFFSYTKIEGDESLLGCMVFTTIFLIIFAFVRLRSKDIFINMLTILVKRKKTEIVLNEGISSNLVCYILSLILSFSAIAASVVFIGTQKFIPEYVLLITGGLLVYHFLFIILIKLLGWTFNSKAVASEIIVNLWTYHIMGGLIIAPFIIAIFFVKTFAVASLLKIIIFSLILFYIVKFIRWIEILFIHRVLIFYMILYLCALEVMPLLILYKFLA